jgi:hypothetical protein
MDAKACQHRFANTAVWQSRTELHLAVNQQIDGPAAVV